MLDLLAKRRLCNRVGGRIVEGWAAYCCAVSAARSRAATTTNLARSSLALVLRTIFGGAKSCAFNDSPSYPVAEAPLGQEVEREVLRARFPLFGPLLFGPR